MALAARARVAAVARPEMPMVLAVEESEATLVESKVSTLPLMVTVWVSKLARVALPKFMVVVDWAPWLISSTMEVRVSLLSTVTKP
jgi:hypothetical protein